MPAPQRVPMDARRAVTQPGVHHRRETCRACGVAALRPFLSLGQQPLANAFLRRPEDFADERYFPLDVYFCETCSLVQLADVIDPEVLFGHYIYVTGTSETMAAHNVRYAEAVVNDLSLGPADLVVEIASNDGSLLSSFAGHGVRTLGVEPARNIAEMARARGIDTLNRFFNGDTARDVRRTYGPATAVIGNNVLAHVDDTRDFLAGARQLISDRGRVIVEVPYAQDMLERGEYDTVYHEHLCYFSVTSLARLGSEVGLGVVRVDRVPVHGGSIRVWFGKGAAHEATVVTLMDSERRTGLTTYATWEAFGRSAAENRTALRLLLEQLHGDGRTVAGYGAPAKGNTLLNYCGIDTALLPYTVDRNALKVGTMTPGMHIPVLPVDTLLQRMPDYVLILAWNFADEIVRQQRQYQERGGRFILPIPAPRVI